MRTITSAAAFIILLSVLLSASSCRKAVYKERPDLLGWWSSNNGQFITISDDGKGSYFDCRQANMGNCKEERDGKAYIRDNKLIVARKKFTINKYPGHSADGSYSMILGDEEFYACRIAGPNPASDITHTSAKLSWSQPVNTLSIVLEYKERDQFQWTTVVLEQNASPYTLPGLTPATDYEWRLKTVCEFNQTLFTQVQSFTTL